MTSPANKQNPPAPNPSPAAQTGSYASAASALKKPAAAATPVIATGSNPAVVGPAPVSAQHNASSSSASPMNGKPQITPAIPAVVRGSSSMNGNSADHSRKSSVTMGPSSFAGTNGGPVGGPKGAIPQFGFAQDSPSPHPANSTPQQSSSAQIRVPSPARAPSPIPISGGRPPSTIPQDGSSMKFGSLGGDSDRQMKHHHPSVSQNSIQLGTSPHSRHDSTHSVHTDIGHHGGQGPNRGGFQGQAGRGGGRGAYGNNPQFGGPSMGYSPNAQFNRGPVQPGRGGMPQHIPGRNPMPQFVNSPQLSQASPNMANAHPGGARTPQMTPSMPIQGGPPTGYNQQFQYGPPNPGAYPNAHQNFQPYHYDGRPTYGMGQMGNQMGAQMPGYPAYNQMPFMGSQSPSPSPAYASPFTQGQYNPPAQPMSRNPSQVSERPSSSTGQAQAPVIVQSGTPQPTTAPAKSSAVVASGTFQKAKRTPILIKNPQGEIINFSALKAPASPVPTVPPSRTPPVIASTPTPPPKATTPSHVRSESTATAGKTTEQLQNEFKERVRKTIQTPAESESKVQDESALPSAAEVKPSAELVEAVAPSKTEDKSAEPPKVAEDATPKDNAELSKPAATTADAEAATPEETEEERLEREIAEMEAEDARREAEQAEYTAKKKRDAEKAKKAADERRAAETADNDRKLQDQEREMERIEEERERKRAEREAGEAEGEPRLTFQQLLEKERNDVVPSDKKDKEASPATADSVTAKLNDLKISGSEGPSSALPAEPAASKSSTEKRAKPAALSLAPLNTKAVEPPQPSAALQSLRTARFIASHEKIDYPDGIASPNPALNLAVSKKGNFKYDSGFLLQFKEVFTEQPSIDFGKQVKVLMGEGEARSARTPAAGGSGRQNSRSAAAPAMGSFGSFGAGGKTLPPGTTSDQRFAMSSGNMARPNLPPMAAFGRPGAFPGPSQMSRTPSSSNMGMPNSPRQGSRNTRGGSKRDNYNAKAEAQAAKTMPLTAGQEVKALAPTSNGWKPTSIFSKGQQAAPDGYLDPELVQRKVKSALNKMTPEKFERIAQSILDIALQSKDEEDGRTLRQVIQLTFEKATDEAHWANMYARFCKRMLDMMSPEIRDTTILDKNGQVVSGGALFRKYLLNRCQEEFERGWQVDLPAAKEGESKEAVMLSDEYYTAAAAKRRGLGLVQFIGELFKLGMLTERIMHQCVHKLVDYKTTPDEGEIESLTKLLRTIGGNLDSTEKGKPMMDVYFTRIQNMIDIPDLPSRLKFMLMDVVDLRRANWVSNEANKGPKTLEEVRLEAEAAAAAKAAEASRSSQRGPPGGRPPIGRGDARQFSGYNQQPNQVGMDDLRRLKGSALRTTSSNVTLGPQSMFASRSNSGRARLGPGGALGRAGEDSGASSRTGTPPTRDAASHSNAFHVLASMETENPASPPSTAASPALAKAVPDTSGAGSNKKESD